MKVGFVSLGCSKNLIDTEIAIGHFKNNNYEIENNPEKADIIVINTCGFIASAKEEAINTILEMAEYKKKKCKYLIVMGCLVQRYYTDLVKTLPEVDLFIKNRIKPDMSPLAKQLSVHNFLYSIHTAEEPYDKDCFSVIGALLRDRCVCEGFAKAYKLLCDRLGIASIVVVGEALHENGRREPHSWNITRIKGVTAHTDAAWDSRFGGAAYDYFNLCDADIAADHCFDTELYPKCVPNKINYFYKNGLIARDEDELRKIIADRADEPYYSVKLLFPFSKERLAEFPFDIGTLRYNAAQNVIGFIKAMTE